MMLSELITKLEVVKETSGDMEVFCRDSAVLVPISGLSMLHENIWTYVEEGQVLKEELVPGTQVLIIKSRQEEQKAA